MTRRAAFLAVAAGAAYACSPLTVVVTVAMLLLFRYAGRGLEGTERRWVLGVLTTGFLLRVLAIAGLFVTTDPRREQIHALFGDGHFSILRSTWMFNDWQHVEIGAWYWYNTKSTYASPAFDRVLAAIQWFIGASPYALPLVSVAAFFAGTVLLYRLARRSFGPSAALIGLAVLVFWPTFFVWSISMLKESAQLFLFSVAIAAAATAARVRNWGVRAALFGLVLLAAYLNAPIRGGSQVIVLGTIVFGYGLALSLRRTMLFTAVAVCVLVGGALAARRPSVRAAVDEGVQFAMMYHLGNVRTPGNPFLVADERFYTARLHFSQMRPPSFDESARFLMRSAAMFVMVPLPVHMVSNSVLLFLPQQVAWLLLLALAVAGAWVGFRRDPLLTSLCVGHCLMVMIVVAPNSGNVGTLIRHRDIIVPLAVWLGGLGAMTALGRVSGVPHANR